MFGFFVSFLTVKRDFNPSTKSFEDSMTGGQERQERRNSNRKQQQARPWPNMSPLRDVNIMEMFFTKKELIN